MVTVVIVLALQNSLAIEKMQYCIAVHINSFSKGSP